MAEIVVTMEVAAETAAGGTEASKSRCDWEYFTKHLIEKFLYQYSYMCLFWYLEPWRMVIAIALFVTITAGPPPGPFWLQSLFAYAAFQVASS